jgi:surface protein
MFYKSGCANKNSPTDSAGPWCAVTTCPSLSPTASPTASLSLSPTESSTASPTASPSQSPAASPTQYCFPDRATLKIAVDKYISEGCETNPSCATRSQYGLIGTWCVKHVTDMHQLFFGKSSFNSDISNWDVGAVTNMQQMFMLTNFNSDISNWDVSAVTNMLDMFLASSFNSNISNWNVGHVTNMQSMFGGATSFNSDISNWNVSSVTDMWGMFKTATRFNQNLCPWGSKLPSNFNYASHTTDMFTSSGCANKNSPTGHTGPWCAVTNCTP